MKKKILLSLFAVVLLLGATTGCGKKEEKKNEDAIKFKEEYESFNDKSNDYFDYRALSIDEDNPFIFATDEEIVKMIENKETFIVYFGDPQCPWCRSIIEQAIKSAKKNGIDKIYYVRFWDGFHEEKIRDVYELDENNKPKLKQEGSKAYPKLLEYLDNVSPTSIYFSSLVNLMVVKSFTQYSPIRLNSHLFSSITWPSAGRNI